MIPSMSLRLRIYLLLCLLSLLVLTHGTQRPQHPATTLMRSGKEAWITPAPHLQPRDVETWGFVSGNSNSPLTCPGGYTQTVDGAYPPFIACCNAVTCFANWHTCVDYGGNECPYPDVCSRRYTAYTSCPRNTPACVVYERVTGPQDNTPLTSYGCGATASQILVLRTSTSGDGAASGTTTSSTSITASNTGISGGESLTPASPASSSTSLSPPSHSTGVDAGAIAGIVGGVVAAIGILVAIFLRFPVHSLRWITCRRYPRARVRTPDGGSRPPNDYEMRGRILHRRRAEEVWIQN